MKQVIEHKTCKAVDGVQIVYSVAGAGQPALVFIHGGLANRGFWHEELKGFADRHRVIALDCRGTVIRERTVNTGEYRSSAPTFARS